MFDESWLRQNAHRVIGGPPAPDPAPHSAPACLTEEEEHRAVIAWRDRTVCARPALADLTHFPSGGKRTTTEAGVFRALGLLPGFPDLMLFHRPGSYVGLAVEMKGADRRGRLGDLSDSQAGRLIRLAAQGWAVDVCWTAEQFVFAATNYLDEPDTFVGGL